MKHNGIDFSPPQTKEEWDRFSPSAKQTTLAGVKESIINSIRSIKCHIHYIEFTGKSYTYNDIQNVMGTLFGAPPPSPASKYRKKSYRVCDGNKWKILTNPDNRRFLPQCKLTVTGIDFAGLIDLAIGLPSLNVAKAEYAMDLKCDNPAAVRALFNLIKMYAYSPGQQAELKYFYQSSNRTIKIRKCRAYERGPNSAAIWVESHNENYRHREWPYNVLDRVRIEFTANTEDLKKNYTRSITDFIASPQFHRMSMTPGGRRRLRFARFNDSSNEHYVKEWMSYDSELKMKKDNETIICYPNSFQNEYRNLIEFDKRASSKVVDDEAFGRLKILIRQAMYQFHREWRKQYHDYFNQHPEHLDEIEF